MSPRAPRSSAPSATLRPDVVLTHDPWKRYRLHPDHRVTGELVCDAIVGARDPHFFRDLGIAHFRPTALMLFEADLPNHAEDVTAQVDVKLAALLAHVSQFESTMHAAGGDQALLDAFATRDPHPARRARRAVGPALRRGVRAHGRSVDRNCPAARPSPGGPANTWAMAIHRVASAPTIVRSTSST